MKKQIFTIILLLMGGVTAFGQFKFDGGVNSLRLQTNGIDRMYIQPAGINANTGSVGINTIIPDAKLTINGDMSFKNITRFTVNGGYTATNRNGASVLIFEAGGVVNGIAGGVDGMLLYVLCGYKMPSTITTGALIIKHEESVSETTAANRIMTQTGADFTITNGVGGVMMVYDGGRQRWRIMEVTSGSSSFSGWGLTGNSGSNPATDFIGTTDAQPLAFKTNNVERMRILSGGNVGIGTNAPDRKLHVYNGNSGRTPFSLSSIFTENSSHNYIEIASPDVSERGLIFSNPTDGASGGVYYENKSMNFRTNVNDTRMKILANGNVGIGTTTPDAKLDIDGNIRIGETLITAGSTTYDPINPNGKSVLTFNPAGNATYTVKGITAPAILQSGYLLYITSTIGVTLVLKNDAATATNNNIKTSTGADVTITDRGGATLLYVYDVGSSSGAWIMIGLAQ
jgi:hypothetical protein